MSPEEFHSGYNLVYVTHKIFNKKITLMLIDPDVISGMKPSLASMRTRVLRCVRNLISIYMVPLVTPHLITTRSDVINKK